MKMYLYWFHCEIDLPLVTQMPSQRKLLILFHYINTISPNIYTFIPWLFTASHDL